MKRSLASRIIVPTFAVLAVFGLTAFLKPAFADPVDQVSLFRRSPEGRPTANGAMQDLGRLLFFDPRLSASGGTSCATCHPPENGWSGLTSKAVGDKGGELAYRSPTLLDIEAAPRLGWTGRFRNLVDVSLFALTAPTNMAADLDRMASYLEGKEAYRKAFASAFGSGKSLDEQEVGQALAAFVASIRPKLSRFDRWTEGDEKALNPSEVRGFALFIGKAGCVDCHSGQRLTDDAFHDIGLPGNDLGRGKLFAKSQALQYAFKTPTLRDVASRSPYMHDGRFRTLEEVIDFYNGGGISRPGRSPIAAPLQLTQRERVDLVAFLGSLSPEPFR